MSKSAQLATSAPNTLPHNTDALLRISWRRRLLRWGPERARQAIWRSRNAWRLLTEGMEVEALWIRFRSEAEISSQSYDAEVDWRSIHRQTTWKQPFHVMASVFRVILKKLSPPRRVFLLFSVMMALVALTNPGIFPIAKDVEILIAYVSLLSLLALELGDHVTMKRDIEIAREIQRWLVPRVPPRIPGTDMAFETRPAKTIGGDYYDAFRRWGNGPLLLAVADVTGKSVPAAILVATFQATLRALAGSRGALEELVSGLNHYGCAASINGRRYTTAFLAEFDPSSGVLRYISAGHSPPCLRHQDGKLDRLVAENIPLGIDVCEHYVVQQRQLSAGDLLVLYTDGVVEAQNERGERFGEGRLLDLIEHCPAASASHTLRCIMRGLDQFVGHAAQHDDVTCLVLLRT